MKKIIVTTCLLATGFLLTACGESQSSNESQQTTIHALFCRTGTIKCDQ